MSSVLQKAMRSSSVRLQRWTLLMQMMDTIGMTSRYIIIVSCIRLLDGSKSWGKKRWCCCSHRFFDWD